jgi:DNA polymerase I
MRLAVQMVVLRRYLTRTVALSVSGRSCNCVHDLPVIFFGVQMITEYKVSDFCKAARDHGSFTFDVEHLPDLSVTKDGFKLHGVGLATFDGDELLCDYVTDLDKAAAIINQLFRDSDVEAIAFNAKYDLKCLVQGGIIEPSGYPKNLVDPMVGMNLLDDNRQPQKLGLKVIVEEIFGHKMASFSEGSSEGLDSLKFRKYAREDAEWELKLWDWQRPQLVSQNLLRVLQKIVCPAVKVFADMEMAGIGWSLKGARELLRGYQLLRDELEAEIYSVIGHLNIGSGPQLAKRLFEELGYSTRGIGMTPKGDRHSVDAQAMDKLASRYPVCAKIRSWRYAGKMISTYVEPCTRRALDDRDSRVHPTFWLVSTTGRTRCEKPNFQNIPAFLPAKFKHLSLRNNVVAAPGRRLVVADLSQIELRLIAHVSSDSMFLKAYREYECTACGTKGDSPVIHHECPECGMAENDAVLKNSDVKGFWHGLDIHQQTTDLVPALDGNRQNGKTANFALGYCATASRMHYEWPSLSIGQWQQVIDDYFDVYRGVRKWHIRMERLLWESGVCSDIFGRKRRIRSNDVKRNPKHALNMIVNFSPQSSACAMMELAMARLRDIWIDESSWMNGIWPTNFVHDEVVYEVHEELVDSVVQTLVDQLEHSVQLQVPVRADVMVVDRWGDAK